ncbi:CocE/NonD family hydrolase [Streptomyces sp. NPDC048290]|uniref:CocE/NonD family hydrolase n=1 Tax=Streptomyces sp. NPDC048290 TaxID=3155811 RepID=UPI00342FAF7E
MRIRTSFPCATTHQDVRVPLSDGTLLYARVWRPVTDTPVPALLELLPFRLTDMTASRDAQRHPWYAGHGYASVRVDARGHGNSGGVPGGGPAADAADAAEVVEWLAARPWCDGGVGMIGISWGGSLALRTAALAPGPLKAVVSVCATDDHYDNDGQYAGGSVLAADLPGWSARLLALAARPPDPRHVGDGWRDLWRYRLDALEPPAHDWLDHQVRDMYWSSGAVREDYGAIRAAVLTVGGLHDPYRDTVLRLVEHLPAGRVRGLLGPWPHTYPDRGRPPGPAIGFLQETLRWWDRWLKGRDTGVDTDPPLRVRLTTAHAPAPSYGSLPGRWTGEPGWPSPYVTPVVYALQGAPVLVRSPMHTGVDAGAFLPRGEDADLPPDQRAEDGRSVCFDFPLGAGTAVLGRPLVRLRLRCEVPRGQVIARLCDIAPDGSSTLVTRGVLNLSARTGRERAVGWPPGATEEVSFALGTLGHVFAPGHRVRLAVSSAYWPWVWPQPGSEAGFFLDPAGSSLELPVRRAPAGTTSAEAPVGAAVGVPGEAPGGAHVEAPGDAPVEPPGEAHGDAPGDTPAQAPGDAHVQAPGDTPAQAPDDVHVGAPDDTPEQAEPLGVVSAVTLDAPRPGRLVVRDVARGEWRLEIAPGPRGTWVHPDGLEVTEEALESYTVRDGDALSARSRSDRTIRLHRPDAAWDTRVRVRSEMSCTATEFLTVNEVICTLGREVVFHRTWEHRTPRTAS